MTAPTTFNVTATVYKPDGVTPETGTLSVTPSNQQVNSGNVIAKEAVRGVLVGGVLKAADGSSTLTLAVSETGYIGTWTFAGVAQEPFFIPGDPDGGTFDLSAAGGI